MAQTAHIYIISCGIYSDELSNKALQIIAQADVLYGGKRLLQQFATADQRQIILGADTVAVVTKIATAPLSDNIVILASGDAMFHGIAATVGKLIDSECYTILPNITAFQALCAQQKTAWSDYSLFSIHGQQGVVPLYKIISAYAAIVYCDHRCPAHQLATELIAKYPATAMRQAVIGANLGLPDEVTVTGPLAQLAKIAVAPLSILLLKPATKTEQRPALMLGRDDNCYQHEKNLITHPEVRAVIIAKLALHGGVMWDLGAGSGSVGLEAAAICDHLVVYAVEKSLTRVKQIIANQQNIGLNNHHTINDNILTQIARLPVPQTLFIGGGGKDLPAIITAAFAKLAPGGTMVASAVTLESIATLNNLLPQAKVEAVTIAVSRSRPIADLTMMKADNPITIFTYHKEI